MAGKRSWIAGVVYLQNLMYALDRYGNSDLFSHSLILPEIDSDFVRKESSGFSGKVVQYSTVFEIRQNWLSRLNALGSKKKTQSTLQAIINEYGIHTLFPVFHHYNQRMPVKTIGWIPDFQHLHFPEFFNAEERASRNRRFKELIEKTDHLVVSSYDALKDLEENFDFVPDRTSVLPFVTAPASDWFHDSIPHELLLRKHQISKRYLMFPAQFWKHKNHETLFKALSILKKRKKLRDIHLLCTGFQGDYRNPDHAPKLLRLLKEESLENHVTLPGVLPRKEQIQLLRHAEAIIQPSLFEGWSSLVEDARLFGKRILLSDIPIHREQNPENALFFDPMNSEQLAGMLFTTWNTPYDGDNLQIALSLNANRQKCFASDFENILTRVLNV